jgi:tRNA/tmRNA/rRNA uracil-C5-methylase (TrmA/RlmC/RlmD family)
MTQVGDNLHLLVDSMSHGGRAISRYQGQVVFIDGAYPGESVVVEITRLRKRHLEAKARSIAVPSPHRVAAPCRHFGSCGGCQWQDATRPAQLEWKRSIVADQLRHLGRLPDVEVRPTLAPGPAFGYRNRMDFRLIEGRPALARAASHDLVAISECHLMVPPLLEAFHHLPARPDASRLTIRAGVGTGETLVMFDEETGVLHERVAGKSFRITGRAFFQVNTAGAETLVALVGEALSPAPEDVFLDAYAGGGLFTSTVGAGSGQVLAVESDRVAIADFVYNTGRRPITARFEHARSRLGEYWDLAVVDPPRTGLGAEAVEVLLSGRPRSIAYVSCDPASFARDAGLLTHRGYQLDWVQPVDMFPQTFHVELVGAFAR